MIILDYPDGPHVITRVLIRKKQEESELDRRCYDAGSRGTERERDLKILCWWLSRWKNVTQRMLVASRSWQRQENGFSSGTSRRGHLRDTLILPQ